jgi:hypothetical protein
MNIIKRLTKGCTGDCAISIGSSISTCVGHTPTYNKDGVLISRDPNTHSATYRCNFCAQSWDVVNKDGKATITPPVY